MGPDDSGPDSGTAIHIGGSIDRLDLAGDETDARVTDYKSGKPPRGAPQLKGGAELQRCLYAYALKPLSRVIHPLRRAFSIHAQTVDTCRLTIQKERLKSLPNSWQQPLLRLPRVKRYLVLLLKTPGTISPLRCLEALRKAISTSCCRWSLRPSQISNQFGGTLKMSDSPATECLPDASARVAALTDHDRTFLVEAGAGSGKTALMAGRVALLVAEGVQPSEIVAITFTEAAASELLERIERFVRFLLDGQVPLELEEALPEGFRTSNVRISRKVPRHLMKSPAQLSTLLPTTD